MARLEPVADVSTLAQQILAWLEPRAVYNAKLGGDVLPMPQHPPLAQKIAELRYSLHFGENADADVAATMDGYRALCGVLGWTEDSESRFLAVHVANPHLTSPGVQGSLPMEFAAAPVMLEGIRVALRLMAGKSHTKAEAIAPSDPERPEAKPAAEANADVAEEVKTSYEARALQVLVVHPDWSNKQIAVEIGCHPKTLAKGRAPHLHAAKRAFKEPPSIPHGSKSPDGDTEAWSE